MISIIYRWRQEGHPTNGNKHNCHITKCRLISANRPTLPQCGKEDVVPCGLRSRDIKRYYDDDGIQNVHTAANAPF